MAKLSAHGTEVARFQKECIAEAIESRTTFSIRSDDAVLRKYDRLEKGDGGDRRVRSSGWKRFQYDRSRFFDLNSFMRRLKEMGYVETRGRR